MTPRAVQNAREVFKDAVQAASDAELTLESARAAVADRQRELEKVEAELRRRMPMERLETTEETA